MAAVEGAPGQKRPRAAAIADEGSATRRRAAARRAPVRYVHLCVDCSEAINRRDMVPSRLVHVAQAARRFCASFFDSNPLGQLGLLVTREGVCERLCPLRGSPAPLLAALADSVETTTGSGSPSVENVLRRATQDLAAAPQYASRELILIFNALQSCDPGDVDAGIEAAAEAGVRCSVVGIGGSLRVLERLTERTGGSYGVPLHERHFSELVRAHVTPPPLPPLPPGAGRQAEHFLLMGFPEPLRREGTGVLVLPPPDRDGSRRPVEGFKCPRCGCCTPSLPAVCGVCNLPLADPGHLARAYHGLTPPPPLREAAQGAAGSSCTGCRAAGEGDALRQCARCGGHFCRPCAALIREGLHCCPTCP